MSGKFNPNDYETVKQRKKKFYGDFPDGRIIPELIKDDENRVIFRTKLFKSREDQKDDLILAIGYAHELRDHTLKTTKGGKSYESINYSSWIENCEESATGRALDNAGYAGNDKCSREEIIKAKKNAKIQTERNTAIMKINSEISNRTNKFQDKESGKRLMEQLGLESMAQIKSLNLDRLNQILSKLDGTSVMDKMEQAMKVDEERMLAPQYQGDVYVFTAGKFKDKKITEVPTKELESYWDFYEKKESVNESTQTMLNEIKSYLESKE
jgi:hypothetical protein